MDQDRIGQHAAEVAETASTLDRILGGTGLAPEPDPCPNPCDHCRPDVWHSCVLDAGHKGHHSCVED